MLSVEAGVTKAQEGFGTYKDLESEDYDIKVTDGGENQNCNFRSSALEMLLEKESESSECSQSSASSPSPSCSDGSEIVVIATPSEPFFGAVNMCPKVITTMLLPATDVKPFLGEQYYKEEKDSISEKRCLCRACRFNRCVAAGMNPLLIQVSPHDIPMVEHGTMKILDELLKVEAKLHFLRISTFCPEKKPFTLAKLLQSPNLVDEVSQFQKVEDWGARKTIFIPLVNGTLTRRSVGFKDWHLCDLVLAVEFGKTFSFFADLPLSDKIALIKGTAAAESSIADSFFSYKRNANTLILPDGEIPVITEPKPPAVMCCMMAKGVEVLIRCQPDEIEYVLLRAIAFANDTAEGLSVKAQDIIRREREKYVKLLFNYLMKKYDTTKGATKFMDYIGAINSYTEIAAKRKEQHSLILALFRPNLSTHPHKFLDETLG
ncbi:unnamed protein product [Enterobius vermicularis]|uniref:NR LBD domain-containing protein n=1 Tax=Enterobius vermicularis TaxID=51028 RepID=A0A0N4V8K5_ENTVE|nr:unnamed protein product [Enterobius vermicularis]